MSDDGFIQVPADSVGKKVDTTEITRTDDVVVERQRVEVRDDDDNVLSTAAVVERLDLILDEIVSLRLAQKQQFEMLLNVMKG